MNDTDYTGQLLDGKYILTRKLGEGGMGAVYLAQHATMGKMVAVKILHSLFSKNEELVHRFIREAQAAVAINHKNIIDIMDLGALPSGEPFIVMEYLKGAGLDELIKVRRQLDIPTACAILEPTLRAIEAAHDKGIIHRDLKPENIFICHSGGAEVNIKLIDFGISKIEDTEITRLTQEGTTLGTPAYMSPEQIRGASNTSHLTDIYAAGIIFYEMLCGDTPFEGNHYSALLAKILTEEPRHPTEVFAGFPMEAWPVIEKAIAKNPADRYQNANEMLTAICTLCSAQERFDAVAGLPESILLINNAKSMPPHLHMSSPQRAASEILKELAHQQTRYASSMLESEENHSPRQTGTMATLLTGTQTILNNAQVVAHRGFRIAQSRLPVLTRRAVSLAKYHLMESPHKKSARIITVVSLAVLAIWTGVCTSGPPDVEIEIVGLPPNAVIFYNNEPMTDNPFEVEKTDKWMPIRVEAKNRTRMRFVITPDKDMRIQYIAGGRKAKLVTENESQQPDANPQTDPPASVTHSDSPSSPRTTDTPGAASSQTTSVTDRSAGSPQNTSGSTSAGSGAKGESTPKSSKSTGGASSSGNTGSESKNPFKRLRGELRRTFKDKE